MDGTTALVVLCYRGDIHWADKRRIGMDEESATFWPAGTPAMVEFVSGVFLSNSIHKNSTRNVKYIDKSEWFPRDSLFKVNIVWNSMVLRWDSLPSVVCNCLQRSDDNGSCILRVARNMVESF